MTGACRRPVLIVEGPGDETALPALLRRIAYEHGIYDFTCCSHTIKGPNLPKLRVTGELEKFLRYAQLKEDGDSVLLCVDTDGGCPKTAAAEYVDRIRQMHLTKKVGVCFFHGEFEAMFISCLDIIAARYRDFGWSLDGWNETVEAEAITGAKGYLSRRMRKEKAYKETRDQVRFVELLDFDRLRLHSRSFRHLEKTWKWLAGLDAEGGHETVRPACGN